MVNRQVSDRVLIVRDRIAALVHDRFDERLRFGDRLRWCHVRGVRAYPSASFDEVYIRQVGPDQEGFFEFYSTDVLPRLRQA